MRLAAGGLLFLLSVLFLLPLVLSRIISMGVIKRAPATHAIAWTFDDGPHPDYTPKLLELLDAYQVKATFFVVGEKARKYPHLIRMMAERGHEIGLHNPVHRPNWFFAPWRLRRELDRMADEIEALTGRRPVFFRPPWGIFSIWDYWYLRPYRMVLWTFLARDWSKKSTPARMTEKILARVKHGAIILLHDGQGDNFRADPAAPARMLAALADALEAMRDWGYEYMTVSQLLERHQRSALLSWWKRCLVSLFLLLDRVIRRLNGVACFRCRDDLLHGHIKTYRGPTLVLSDGTTLKRGDLVLNLHFNNELMVQMAKEAGSPVHLAVRLVRSGTIFLPYLAKKLEEMPFKEVKALHGISLMHRGTRPFGFEAFDLPNGLLKIVTQVYLRLFMAVLHPEGKERVQKREELLIPKRIVMSRQQFLSHYLHKPEEMHERSRSATV